MLIDGAEQEVSQVPLLLSPGLLFSWLCKLEGLKLPIEDQVKNLRRLLQEPLHHLLLLSGPLVLLEDLGEALHELSKLRDGWVLGQCSYLFPHLLGKLFLELNWQCLILEMGVCMFWGGFFWVGSVLDCLVNWLFSVGDQCSLFSLILVVDQ